MSILLRCPQCNVNLKRIFAPIGLFWVCPECNGRAATLPVLRKVFQRETINGLWRSVCDDHHGSSVRTCPSCNGKMVEVPVSCGDGASVMLDACKVCQIVWFDASEFEDIPPSASPVDVEDASIYGTLPEKARERVLEIQAGRISRKAMEDSGSDSPDFGWKWVVALLGLPVELEDQSRSRLPWVTWGIALACTLISFLAFSGLREIVQEYGFVPADPFRHAGVTLVTSFFLHGGLAHLLGNMYFLLMFGDNVEEDLGHWRMFLLMVLAAVIGDVAHLIGNPESAIPCVGASGAISGVLAFYALQNPRAQIGFMVRILILFRWVKMRAATCMILWCLLQVLVAHLQRQGLSNISGLAHLGGVVTGIGFWLMSRQTTPPLQKISEYDRGSREYK